MDVLLGYAMQFVGTPYKWGGKHPLEGYDCSGFVQEILASAGEDPRGDQSAQALYDHFEIKGYRDRWGPGALCFFGESVTRITHVSLMIDDKRMIEAAGGDRSTLTGDDAVYAQAMVRIRPIRSRADLVAVIMPQYAGIGRR